MATTESHAKKKIQSTLTDISVGTAAQQLHGVDPLEVVEGVRLDFGLVQPSIGRLHHFTIHEHSGDSAQKKSY